MLLTGVCFIKKEGIIPMPVVLLVFTVFIFKVVDGLILLTFSV